jgi:hypothetical protein
VGFKPPVQKCRLVDTIVLQKFNKQAARLSIYIAGTLAWPTKMQPLRYYDFSLTGDRLLVAPPLPCVCISGDAAREPGSSLRPSGSLLNEKPRWPGAGLMERLRVTLCGEPTDRVCTANRIKAR